MAKSKTKMGRPPLEPADRRSKLVTVRLTTAEYQQLVRDAKAAGRTVAEHLRQCWQGKGD